MDIYNFIYDQVLPIELEEAGVDFRDVGMGIGFSHQEAIDYLRRVFPPEWIQEQLEEGVNEVLPYATGQRDSFSLTLRIDDRLEEVISTLKAVVQDSDVYNHVLEEVVWPKFKGDIPLSELPYGLELTPDQVIDRVKEVVPEEWFDQQIEEGIDALAPYLTGESESFAIVVPLQARGQEALAVLERWLGDGIEVHTRRYFREGYRFTDQDLRRIVSDKYGSEWVDRLDDAREWTGKGLVVTERDLKDALEPGEIETLENARQSLRAFRGYLFALFAALVAVAGAVGLLAGRGWWSRLGWTVAPLLLSGLLVASGLSAGSSIARWGVDGIIRDADINAAYADKLAELHHVFIDALVGPMVILGSVLLALGVLMLGAGIYGSFFQAERRR